MKRIVISSKGYFLNPSIANNLISYLAKNSETHTILVGSNDIEKISDANLEEIKEEIILIEKNYIKDNKFVLNSKEKMKIKENAIVIIDMSGLYGEKLSELLYLIKREILILDREILALGIICDELEIPIVLSIVLNVFRVNPIYLDSGNIKKYIRNAKWMSLRFKYFSQNRLFFLLKKIKNKIKK